MGGDRKFNFDPVLFSLSGIYRMRGTDDVQQIRIFFLRTNKLFEREISHVRREINRFNDLELVELKPLRLDRKRKGKRTIYREEGGDIRARITRR